MFSSFSKFQSVTSRAVYNFCLALIRKHPLKCVDIFITFTHWLIQNIKHIKMRNFPFQYNYDSTYHIIF
jgi:hypothetical protein